MTIVGRLVYFLMCDTIVYSVFGDPLHFHHDARNGAALQAPQIKPE